MTAPNRFSADFDIVRIMGDRIFIVDLDRGGRSITNDAEAVVKRLVKDHPIKRIIYRDTDGCWGELLHDGREFRGFEPSYNEGFEPDVSPPPHARSPRALGL